MSALTIYSALVLSALRLLKEYVVTLHTFLSVQSAYTGSA